MKRTIKLFALAAAMAVFAVPTMAQKQECNDENKGTWYKTFYDNFKLDSDKQKIAYDAAKTYLDSCPADPNDAQAKYMKKFVDLYDEKQNDAQVAQLFQTAVNNKNYADQLKYGPKVLEKDPDNVDVNVVLGVAGLAEGSLLSQSVPYAKRAISLIESGKTPKVYTKDQALAYLNWTIAKSKLSGAPADAISDLLKVAKIESEVKKNPQLYLDLEAAYEAGPRAKLSDEYTASLKPDKTETDQSKVILENLNRIIDNQIDAMARAAALTTDAGRKQGIVSELTTLYKYRNKTATDASVNELVANVLSKPIPDLPTPVTSLPGPSPSSTPATNGDGSIVNGGTNNGNKSTGSSVTSNTPATGKGTTSTGTATQTGTPKPTSSPTPARKPLKFRRG